VKGNGHVNYLVVLRKSMELSEDVWSPNRGLNPGYAEYEAGLLSIGLLSQITVTQTSILSLLQSPIAVAW
jgi:hypothetical protein